MPWCVDFNESLLFSNGHFILYLRPYFSNILPYSLIYKNNYYKGNNDDNENVQIQ